jgi:hypothetical protein
MRNDEYGMRNVKSAKRSQWREGIQDSEIRESMHNGPVTTVNKQILQNEANSRRRGCRNAAH